MRRRLPEAEHRYPPMWVVDMRFWEKNPELDHLERCRLRTEEVDAWVGAHEHWDGLDPFDRVDERGRVDSRGAWLLNEAEAAIRRGEAW